MALPKKYDIKPYAFGFQKNSPFLPLFDFHLKKLQEKGAIDKILKEYGSKPQICPDYNGLPLGFDTCVSAFLVLIFGMAFGAFLFVLEWIAKCFQHVAELEEPTQDFVEEVSEEDKKQTIKIRKLQMKIDLLRMRKSQILRQIDEANSRLIQS